MSTFVASVIAISSISIESVTVEPVGVNHRTVGVDPAYSSDVPATSDDGVALAKLQIASVDSAGGVSWNNTLDPANFRDAELEPYKLFISNHLIVCSRLDNKLPHE